MNSYRCWYILNYLLQCFRHIGTFRCFWYSNDSWSPCEGPRELLVHLHHVACDKSIVVWVLLHTQRKHTYVCRFYSVRGNSNNSIRVCTAERGEMRGLWVLEIYWKQASSHVLLMRDVYLVTTSRFWFYKPMANNNYKNKIDWLTVEQ